jgi:Transposase/Transposase IS116/IS110/IS902 family
VLMFVGIDWASTEHAVCVLDQTGETIRAFRIPYSAAGFDDLVARLGRLGAPAELPVAIERPDGRLVDRLLEAGHPVVPVRSNAIKAWREARSSRVPSPTQPDAAVIAEYLRLRRHRLRVLAPFGPPPERCGPPCARGASWSASAWPPSTSSPLPWRPSGQAPRPCSRRRTRHRARLPGALSDPSVGRRPRRAAHGRVPAPAWLRGRTPAAELVAWLRAAPAGCPGAPRSPPAATSCSPSWRAAGAQSGHPRPGPVDHRPSWRASRQQGLRVTATLRSDQRRPDARRVGDCRDAYQGPEAVAALAGIVPVTRQSGKHTAVSFRWACNKRFRNAMTTFAHNSRQASPGLPRSTPTPVPAATTIPRHPRPCSRLGPGDLALLGRPGALRPCQAWGRPKAS